ncbi:MAG: hypothetical protein ABIP48_05235 [Planctomycetota bacterium]
MRRILKLASVALAAIGLLAVGGVSASAQSGGSGPPAGGSSEKAALSEGSETRAEEPPGGSGSRVEQAPIALEGYCPVSVLAMRKWVKGDPGYPVVYDGRTYLFANAEGKEMFEGNAAKYVPALGGDCVVALVKMGKRVPGNIRHATVHDGRLFLFSNRQAQQIFVADPATYANTDLALGGNCPVCLVNLGKDVPGKPELAAFHQGFRYLFPAVQQRDAFLATPEKYLSATGNGPQPASGSTTRQPAGADSASR